MFKHKNNSSWNDIRRLIKSRPSINRVKTYEVVITSTKKLSIKFRKFRTSPTNRSAKFKQSVYQFNLFGYKEVAISYRRNKKLPTRRLIYSSVSTTAMTLGIMGVVIFGMQIFSLGQVQPPVVEASEIVVSKKQEIMYEQRNQLEESLPISITLDAINVKAEIITVGLLDNGAIETPAVLSGQVGWYEYGPTPGELGPAVLVGHVDSYKGPSVFWNLSKLTPGEMVSVNRKDGSIAKFIVTKIVQYEQDKFGTDEVYGNIDYAGLRIITCGGRFNHLTGHYSHNTVVFAELEI